MAKSLSLARLINSPLLKYTHKLNNVRYLYSKEALGIENYIQTRQRVALQFTNVVEKFRNKMEEFVEPKAANMIFTEDLKNMIHLAENNDKDVELIKNMILRFNKQNTTLRFGNFIFGPVVMRMYYYLNKPDEALECFTNKELDGFFDQLITYQILMDLLFINKKYDKVIEVFELIKSKQIQNAKYPKQVVVLTLAALYKQNTQESYKYALELWNELQNVGHIPLRKASTFMAGLALNQKAPDVALEVLANVSNQTYMTVRNIKVAALSQINRLDDAIHLLKSVLQVDTPTHQKFTFNKDVLDQLNEAIQKSQNKEYIVTFERISKQLQENGNITDNTLDYDLCRDILPNATPFVKDTRTNRLNRSVRYENPRQKRPSLYDLQ